MAGCGNSGFDPPPPVSLPPPPPPPSPPPSTTGTITGTISGLQGSGLVLANATDGRTLAVDAGATTFALNVTDGPYNIVVISPPISPAQACTVNGGMGYGPQGAPNVTIACTSDIGLLGGTITGLTGSGLELVQSNGDVATPAAGATTFRFASGLASGMRYSVGIGHQPVDAAQTCTIRRGKGVMLGTGGVNDIAVECVDNKTSVLSGTFFLETPPGKPSYLTFFPDGTYSYVLRMDDPSCGENNGNGVEYGVYQWSASDSPPGTGPFSIVNAVIDTNGDCGLAQRVGGSQQLLSGTLSMNYSGSLEINTGNAILTLTAVEERPDQPVGSFEPGTARMGDSGQVARVNRVSGAFTVFTNDGRYVSVEAQDASSDDGKAGAEWGCVAWSPDVLTLTCYTGGPDPWPLDLNGTGGLSERFRYGYGDINLSLGSDWMVTNERPSVGYLDYFWWRVSSSTL